MNQPLTLDLEAAYLRELTLNNICNSFERISEQLSVLHNQLNAPPVAESEVLHVN